MNPIEPLAQTSAGPCGVDEMDSKEASEKDTSEFGRGEEHCSPSIPSAQQTQGENGRCEENLKKFLEEKSYWKIRSREEMKASQREVKSDSEIDYCDEVSKISSKVKLKRSSAPPTFESISRQNLETEKLPVTSPDNSSVMPESNEIPLENSATPISSRTEKNLLSVNASENSMSISLANFKAPINPTCVTSTPEEPKSRTVSPDKPKVKDSSSTPVLRRPTEFNFKHRKAFDAFSPDHSSVLRQSQSLPNINRIQRKEEKRRTGKRSRIVRALFVDKPEPSTPETRQSTVPKRNFVKYSTEVSSSDRASGSSKEKRSLAGETLDSSSQSDRKAKFCRKLTFTRNEAAEARSAKQEKSESPQKRKEVSPAAAESSSTCHKKVRMSPQLKKIEGDIGSKMMVDIETPPKEERSSMILLAEDF